MGTTHRWRTLFQVSVVCLSFLILGCEDGNLFGGLNDRGGSGNVESLLSDANIALREKNYSSALALYNRILAQDSDNAQALYGAAAANIGTSGLNIGVLIANITGQLGAPSVTNLSELIAQSRESISPAIGSDPNSLLDGIDLTALNAVIDDAICQLSCIVSGATDGSIAPNDIDVLLNLASLCVVRAALRPLRALFMDIVNTNGTYSVNVSSGTAATFCSNSDNLVVVQTIAKDVAGAYALFNRAVTVLNLSNNQIIQQLRDDIQTAATEVLAASGNLPTQCINIFTGVGITAASFTSYSAVFDTAPTGC